MKLKILLDNNTRIDGFFFGEPGVSYLLEEKDNKILFDCGYSDAFIRNANKLDENLLDIDFLVFSHGHIDHTWGVQEFIKTLTEARGANKKFKIPKLLTHPISFMSKRIGDEPEIGPLHSEYKLSRHFEIQKQSDPYWFSDNLVWLGEIPRKNNFENQEPLGKVDTPEGNEIDDFLIEDSAFAYKSNNGLVVVSACSHPGICNIIEYAKEVTGIEKIHDVIGGFHLQKPDDNLITETKNYFQKLNADNVHCCHCTDLNSKIELSKVSNVKEVASGDIFEW